MVHSSHGAHISPIPIPTVVRKVVTKGKDEMDEDDRALAAMGYTPVSEPRDIPQCHRLESPLTYVWFRCLGLQA